MGKNREELMKKNFVTCECGYNNSKERFHLYGKCLRCGKILDNKIYFKAIMKDKIIKKDGKEIYM